MERITFTCRTITPLVLNGPYGSDPELRPPAIKAALRFWWRALHGHLTREQLKEEEGKIFGNTKERSKLIVRVFYPDAPEIYTKTELLPHKPNPAHRSPVSCIAKGVDFNVQLGCPSEQAVKIRNLFMLATALGGLGKRSRRGFGSLAITRINDVDQQLPNKPEQVLEFIQAIVPGQYQIVNGSVISRKTANPIRAINYPIVLTIEFASSSTTLTQIAQATHDTMQSDTSYRRQDYQNSLGAGTPRLASPVYVSYFSDGQPIITTLGKNGRVSIALQQSLKDRILQG